MPMQPTVATPMMTEQWMAARIDFEKDGANASLSMEADAVPDIIWGGLFAEDDRFVLEGIGPQGGDWLIAGVTLTP